MAVEKSKPEFGCAVNEQVMMDKILCDENQRPGKIEGMGLYPPILIQVKERKKKKDERE
jgi:hypothetical protein